MHKIKGEDTNTKMGNGHYTKSPTQTSFPFLCSSLHCRSCKNLRQQDSGYNAPMRGTPMKF